MCEILLWRGYVKSGFYAAPASSNGALEEDPLVSPLFRSRRGWPPAEGGTALVAHETLVGRLRAEGWEPAGRGSSWYAQKFIRDASAPLADPVRPRTSVSPEVVSSVVTESEGEWIQATIVPKKELRRSRTSTGVWRRARVGAVFLVASTVGVATAVAPSLLGIQPAQGTPLAPPQVVKPKAKDKSKAVPAAPNRAAPLAHVVIAANRGDSWIEARAGSSTGRVLYTGTLREGETTRVAAPRVWLRLAAAAHLDVLVNGKPPPGAPLLGTLEVVLGPRAAR